MSLFLNYYDSLFLGHVLKKRLFLGRVFLLIDCNLKTIKDVAAWHQRLDTIKM